MTQQSTWYDKIQKLFDTFQKMADAHWEQSKPNNVLELVHTRLDYANNQITVDPINARNDFRELWDLCRTKPQYEDYNTASIKSDMYHLLGLWLCAFFIGIALPDCWERVVALANRLGTYPGGAFYSKLSGDIYRYELRRKAKARLNIKESSNNDIAEDQEPLLIMAFDPILLIPLRDNIDTFVEDITDLSKEEEEFRHHVRQLAFRYLRLEARRYWSEPENPVIYMVSQELASKALKKIKSELVSEDRLKSESLKHLLKFLNIPNAGSKLGAREKQTILIVNPESMRWKGLSSCYLGSSDGVLSVRPNLPDQPSAYCSWIEGEVLALERKKLVVLKEEIMKKKTCIKFDATNPSAFEWYDPSNWKLVKD